MQISARHKKFSVEIFLLLLLTVRLIGRSLRQHIRYTMFVKLFLSLVFKLNHYLL